MFDPYWRQRAVSQLSEPFDLIVIGGGITGCGIAMDAAQRGVRVLLVEKEDIASGTSSRSSKLIHGGLRYLKQMQFRITRLACRERDRLAALNPHLVRPLPFLYPAYKSDHTAGWKVDLGLWMYDRLTSRPEKHTHLDVDEVGELAPGLVVEGLDRALLYTDALADDARLTLAVAATAYTYGALILTRAEVEEPLRDQPGRITGVVVRDLEHAKAYRVRAHVVLNATGHWVDELRERFDLKGRKVRPSRGSHLVFDSGRLPIDSALTVASPDDGRPVFLIPHPEGVLVGTTDHYHEGSLNDPRPSQEEVDYLLRAVAAVFPGSQLGAEDILGTWAGLRPILDSHAEKPSEASREEEIWEEQGLVSVAGGKLTTYRATAEEAVDLVVERLPEERSRDLWQCATAGTPLAGLAPADLADRLLAVERLSPPIAEGLARRLGSFAWIALELASWRRDLDPLVDGCDLCAAEVRAHLRFGAVLRLEDLLLRRVRIGMWRPVQAAELARRLRPYFAAELGWRRKRWQVEKEAFGRALEAWSPKGVR